MSACRTSIDWLWYDSSMVTASHHKIHQVLPNSTIVSDKQQYLYSIVPALCQKNLLTKTFDVGRVAEGKKILVVRAVPSSQMFPFPNPLSAVNCRQPFSMM